MKVPKVCRLQANFIFFFQGSAAEVDIVANEYAPPMYSRNEFKKIVNEASKEKFSFLTINMKVGWDKRFRRKLGELINLHRLSSDGYEGGHFISDESETEFKKKNRLPDGAETELKK